ncbi:hypothetical protein F4802DRAFT_546203 [Xylaria palmicola]|nr:hypothetical protein F4802DRAFT_546203 [Xylaria palmicola]
MEGFPQGEIDYQRAHFDDDNGTAIAVVGSVFVVIAVIAVLFRLAARREKTTKLAWDDYLAIASLPPLLLLDVSSSLSTRWGLGRHLLWVLQDPENIIRIGKVQLGISLGYNFSMLFAKLSVLALYKRIFTFQSKWMKYGVLLTGTVTILWFVAGTLGVFLECRPLHTIWTKNCLPSKASSITFAVINFVTDIVVLSLPQRVIWKLNRSAHERLAISGLFLLGLFATAVTLTRLAFFNHNPGSEHPYDSTYYSTYTILFTVVEPACFVLCGSLPMIPGLFKTWARSPSKTRWLLSLSRNRWPSLSFRGRSQGSGWSKPHEGEPANAGGEGSFKKSDHSSESMEMFNLDVPSTSHYRVQPGQAI